MEVRCKHLLCKSLKTFLVGFLNTRDWSQSFNKTTILVLYAICSVLADLVNKRDRIYWRSCLEENHYID